MKFENLYSEDSFIAFSEGKDDESTQYWKELEEKDPEFKAEVDKCREIIVALKNLHHARVPFDKLQENLYLQRRIGLWERYSGSGIKRRIPVIKIFAVAASILLIMSISLLSYLYFNGSLLVNGEAAYSEVIAPLGEKAEVILPDGSKIWLNSESRLTYPEHFNQGKREVYLEGEAYFDVEKIKNSSFTVNSNDINITVLGTEFNIKNYKNDDDFEVTVVEGSVLVQENDENSDYGFKPMVIKPFEKASISKINRIVRLESTKKKQVPEVEDEVPLKQLTDRKISVSHVDTKAIISWKDSKLIFENESLSEMAVKMTRWYNIPVHLENRELGEERYTGKFVNNENIYQVLNAIELTTPVTHEVRKQ